MARLTIDDLKHIRERAAPTLTLRTGKARARITVHMGTCGIAAGARGVMAALLTAIEKDGVSDVILTASGCAGLCSHEPMVTVELPGAAPVKYVNLTPEAVVTVFRKHVIGGEIVMDHVLGAGCETTG